MLVMEFRLRFKRNLIQLKLALFWTHFLEFILIHSNLLDITANHDIVTTCPRRYGSS